MDIEFAKEKIVGHKNRKEEEARNKALEYREKQTELIRQIRDLEPRIRKIIEIGNLCIENGINLNKVGTYNKCLYKEDAYETDAIHHQLGFFPNHFRGHPFYSCSHYDYIGYRMGGACGNKDFITDGDIVLDISHDDYHELANRQVPSVNHCQMFLDDFDNFEKVFYEFIERL